MRGKQTLYTTLYVASCVIAAAIAITVWRAFPMPDSAWSGIFWFTVAATLSNLLSVQMVGPGYDVTPSAPIYWAAACVIGPFPCVIVCAASGVLSDVISWGAFKVASARESAPGRGRSHDGLLEVLNALGTAWEPRANQSFARAALTSWQFISGLIIAASPASAVYYCLGGTFLISSGPHIDLLRQLVIPYIGLVATSLAGEHMTQAVLMAGYGYTLKANGFYGFLRNVKLALIETCLPIFRAELFLVIVALMMSYLYSSIGVIGIILAAMPVVALRDFFYQWVEEQNAYFDTITTLATYMQHYHPYTRGHLKRVADISVRLAYELRLPAENIRHIGTAGLLHDIGKVGVSEEILDKPGALSNEEWEKIKEHPVKGAEIISHIEFLGGIVDWIKYHHKWFNGAGYPDTNGNGHIPIEASIIAVADSFDAMTDDREMSVAWKCDSCQYEPEDDGRPEACPKCGAAKRRYYREPKSLDEAINELRRGAGSQFHPRVVKAFLSMVERDGVHLDA